jgi:hypothetical protein
VVGEIALLDVVEIALLVDVSMRVWPSTASWSPARSILRG